MLSLFSFALVPVLNPFFPLLWFCLNELVCREQQPAVAKAKALLSSSERAVKPRALQQAPQPVPVPLGAGRCLPKRSALGRALGAPLHEHLWKACGVCLGHLPLHGTDGIFPGRGCAEASAPVQIGVQVFLLGVSCSHPID